MLDFPAICASAVASANFSLLDESLRLAPVGPVFPYGTLAIHVQASFVLGCFLGGRRSGRWSIRSGGS